MAQNSLKQVTQIFLDFGIFLYNDNTCFENYEDDMKCHSYLHYLNEMLKNIVSLFSKYLVCMYVYFNGAPRL